MEGRKELGKIKGNKRIIKSIVGVLLGGGGGGPFSKWRRTERWKKKKELEKIKGNKRIIIRIESIVGRRSNVRTLRVFVN